MLSALCRQWADEARVEIHIDFVANTRVADREAQQRSGHDIVVHPTWQLALHRRLLEPVDDVMRPLLELHGAASPVADYLGFLQGRWHGVPATVPSQLKSCCSRFDLYQNVCGIDLIDMFPVKRDRQPAEQWTWQLYLRAARQLFAAGHPVGLPVGQSSDAVDWTSALFRAFGAVLIDSMGNIVVRSDQSWTALEFARELLIVNPPEAYQWDDADNNRVLIAGSAAGIINPPTAWASATRENPHVAERCWTHDAPCGPAGRFAAHLPFFYGIWNFAQNKSAAKDLLRFLSEPEQVKRLLAASRGTDIPPFTSFYDLDFWAAIGPRSGTLYNYPPRAQTPTIAGFPARPELGSQIYAGALQPSMVVRYTQGRQSLEAVISWAEQQLEMLVCRRIASDCA